MVSSPCSAPLLAWILGLRHAVDADHIAAINTVVRKLMQSGTRPDAVGLRFSLGHSTVVVLACMTVGAASITVPGLLGLAQNFGGVAGTLPAGRGQGRPSAPPAPGPAPARMARTGDAAMACRYSTVRSFTTLVAPGAAQAVSDATCRSCQDVT